MWKLLNLKSLFSRAEQPLSPDGARKRNKMMVVMAAVVVGGLLAPRYICVTTTASLKDRVYLVAHHPEKVGLKDFVIFPHSNYATDFKKQNVMKQIVCDEGDNLRVTSAKEYYCNDRYLGRAKDRSLKGEVVDNYIFNGQVPPGKMFVMEIGRAHV